MESSNIELISDLGLDLVESWGSDRRVIEAARVSTQTEVKEGDEKLIAFLMKNKHASPFEHMGATFLVDAPLFVAREWHRHRTQSYNEVSGRYSILKPRFYAPGLERPLTQIGKPGAYKFSQGTDEQVLNLWRTMRINAEDAWNSYTWLLEQGIAKEVARMVLPVNTYTSWYASANIRNWLSFLSLRTAPDAMFEIRQLAGQVETQLHKLFPVTLNAWDEFGRGSV